MQVAFNIPIIEIVWQMYHYVDFTMKEVQRNCIHHAYVCIFFHPILSHNYDQAYNIGLLKNV